MIKSILYDSKEDELFIRVYKQKEFKQLVFSEPDKNGIVYIGELNDECNLKKLSKEIYQVLGEPKIIFDVLMLKKFINPNENSMFSKKSAFLGNNYNNELTNKQVRTSNLYFAEVSRIKEKTKIVFPKFYEISNHINNPDFSQIAVFLTKKQTDKKQTLNVKDYNWSIKGMADSYNNVSTNGNIGIDGSVDWQSELNTIINNSPGGLGEQIVTLGNTLGNITNNE